MKANRQKKLPETSVKNKNKSTLERCKGYMQDTMSSMSRSNKSKDNKSAKKNSLANLSSDEEGKW